MALADSLRTSFLQWFDCSPVTVVPAQPKIRCGCNDKAPGPQPGDQVFCVTDDLHDRVFDVDVNPSVPNQTTITVTNHKKGRVFQDTLPTGGIDVILLRDRILLAGEQLLLVARDKDQYDWLSAREWIIAYGRNNANDPTGTLP